MQCTRRSSDAKENVADKFDLFMQGCMYTLIIALMSITFLKGTIETERKKALPPSLKVVELVCMSYLIVGAPGLAIAETRKRYLKFKDAQRDLTGISE